MTIPQDSNSQKNQDKQKEGAAIDNGLNANTSSGIELLLLLEGKSGEYMESGRYEDCYEVTRRLYHAGPDANFVTVLLRYGAHLLNTNALAKCELVRKELQQMLQKKLKLPLYDVVKCADKLKRKHQFQALLLYQVMSNVYKINSPDAAQVIHRMAFALKVLASQLLKSKQVSEEFIEKNIISYLHKLNDCLSKIDLVPMEKLACVQAICLHYTEQCQGLIDDFESQEKTLKNGIKILNDGFAGTAVDQEIYGTLLNNLGNNYLKTNRFNDAISVLTQAINVMKKTAYDCEKERYDDIERAKEMLRHAKIFILQQ